MVKRRKAGVLGPFYRARSNYFNWLYTANRDAWFVLDPVITVHPERVLFEAFSQDESTYCAVSISHDAFARTGAMAYGTTNIDRWRHGMLLFRMLFFAASKLKFI